MRTSPGSCVTGGVSLPSAQRLAQEGHWDDVELVYADRLVCKDASYACVLRDHYRAEKQWAEADRLRNEIQAAGFEVRDTRMGTQVVARD
jgi:cysteinyl-tRNA synthetase